ncbi:hypothetical protein HDV05_003982 [Chytridiales sp. JEL 0842]|nr:hypothetical protein HDV05_003982 [Chytridiales sp. JEL 0842]
MVPASLITAAALFVSAVTAAPVEQAASKYYYDFPLQTVARSFSGRGGGNHPETFEFAVKVGACPNGPANTESIYARANRVYGSVIEIACLNLADGTMYSANNQGGRGWDNKTVSATEPGHNQIAYVNALKNLDNVARFFVSGNPYPPLNQAPVPELQSAAAYLLSAAEAHLETVTGALQLTGSYTPEGGELLHTTFQVVTNQERDLIAEFRDDQGKAVNFARLTVPKGNTFQSNLGLIAPNVAGPTTLVYALVKTGDTFSSAALDGSKLDMVVPKLDRVNFVYCEDGKAGQQVRCYVSYRQSSPKDIRVDFFNADGSWLSGQQDPTPAEKVTTGLDVFVNLPADTKVGSYKVIAKILPVGGAWNSFLDQVASPHWSPFRDLASVYGSADYRGQEKARNAFRQQSFARFLFRELRSAVDDLKKASFNPKPKPRGVTNPITTTDPEPPSLVTPTSTIEQGFKQAVSMSIVATMSVDNQVPEVRVIDQARYDLFQDAIDLMVRGVSTLRFLVGRTANATLLLPVVVKRSKRVPVGVVVEVEVVVTASAETNTLRCPPGGAEGGVPDGGAVAGEDAGVSLGIYQMQKGAV